MENNELRAELIRFCDSIRNYEHESGHSIYQDERESSEFVDIYLKDSHSPNTEQYDTLQEGDYAPNLSKEQYDHLIKIEGDTCVLEYVEGYGLAFINGILVDDNYPPVSCLKTQLTPEEFIRRAENTFNNQKS